MNKPTMIEELADTITKHTENYGELGTAEIDNIAKIIQKNTRIQLHKTDPKLLLANSIKKSITKYLNIAFEPEDSRVLTIKNPYFKDMQINLDNNTGDYIINKISFQDYQIVGTERLLTYPADLSIQFLDNEHLSLGLMPGSNLKSKVMDYNIIRININGTFSYNSFVPRESN